MNRKPADGMWAARCNESRIRHVPEGSSSTMLPQYHCEGKGREPVIEGKVSKNRSTRRDTATRLQSHHKVRRRGHAEIAEIAEIRRAFEFAHFLQFLQVLSPTVAAAPDQHS